MDDPLTYAIIGAAMAVHNDLGPGYVEAAYHRALEMALTDAGVAFESEVPLPLHFKARPLGVAFRVDVVCAGSVVVELKALPAVGARERRQVAHYLKSTKMPLGLLLNFGEDSLHMERIWSKIPTIAADSLKSQAAHG